MPALRIGLLIDKTRLMKAMSARRELKIHGTQSESKNAVLSLFAPAAVIESDSSPFEIEIQRPSPLGAQRLSLRLDPQSTKRLIPILRLALEDGAPPSPEKSSTGAALPDARWSLLLRPDLKSAASARCLGLVEGHASFWSNGCIAVFRLSKENDPIIALAIASTSWLMVRNIALALDRAAVELLLEGLEQLLA